MEIVTVLIDDKVHQMTDKVAKVLIKMAKEKYRKEMRNAIVAVEKDGKIEMRRDVFGTFKDLQKQAQELKANGFKAHYVKRW